MRFRIDKIHQAQQHPEMDAIWQEASTPGEIQVQVLGLAVSFMGMLFVAVILQGQFVPQGLLFTLSILFLTAPAHELLHAISTPGWGFSPNTIFGIRQYRGVWTPYVSFDGEQPLWRFLLTGLTPTILLTLLPLLVVMFLPSATPYHAELVHLGINNYAESALPL
jgi:hypothetical protein